MIARTKILISVPNKLAARIRAALPVRRRSQVITHLLEKEIQRREQKLYEAALAAEKDAEMNEQMREWDITINDGMNDDEKRTQ